jgi:hypothetical protein
MHEALLDLDLPSPPADIKMKVGRRFRKIGPSSLLKAISTTFV